MLRLEERARIKKDQETPHSEKQETKETQLHHKVERKTSKGRRRGDKKKKKTQLIWGVEKTNGGGIAGCTPGHSSKRDTTAKRKQCRTNTNTYRSKGGQNTPLAAKG